MSPKPSYEALAVAVARCVYDELNVIDGGGPDGITHVYDRWSSGYQIPALVLRRFDILEPLNGADDRSTFTCKPEAFLQVIEQNKSSGPSYDLLVLAAICLLENYPHVDYLREILTKANVVEPDTGARGSVNEEIRWTKTAGLYNRLYNEWTDLVESSRFDDPRLDP